MFNYMDLLIDLLQEGRAPMRSVSDGTVVSAKGGPAYERAVGSKLFAILSCSIFKYTTFSIVYDVKICELFKIEARVEKRGRSSVGRTPALHAGGQRFKSARLQKGELIV